MRHAQSVSHMFDCCPTVLCDIMLSWVFGTGQGRLSRRHITVSDSASGAIRRSLVSAKLLVRKVDDVLVARHSCSSASPACLISHFALACEPLQVRDAEADMVIWLSKLAAVISATPHLAQVTLM